MVVLSTIKDINGAKKTLRVFLMNLKYCPKKQNCRKTRPDWAKWLFIQVSVAPNRVESVEIFQTTSPFFYSVL